MRKYEEVNYTKQRKKGLERKIKLIKYFGGKCEICGYDKNIAALEFHHKNSEEKEFQLDMRHMANNSEEVLLNEAKKCMLICSNCHKELHYPHLDSDRLEDTLNGLNCEILKKKSPIKKSKYICENCGKPFKAVTRKRFCCADCRRKSKNYPTYEELKKKYTELNSWTKVAEFYSLNRNIIRRIRRIAGEEHC